MFHLHKRLTDAQIVTILTQYVEKKISTNDAQVKMGVKRSRFFRLLKGFLADRPSFTVVPVVRERRTRISKEAETHIRAELEEEKKLIDNKDVPVRSYNYSAVRDVLKEKHNTEVSVPTIINRAKSLGFYTPRTICSRRSCRKSSTSSPRSTITRVFFCSPIFSSKRRRGIILRR